MILTSTNDHSLIFFKKQIWIGIFHKVQFKKRQGIRKFQNDDKYFLAAYSSDAQVSNEYLCFRLKNLISKSTSFLEIGNNMKY